MKFFNVERRIKYLGFDDKWLIVIGAFILSFVADYLFSKSFSRGLSWDVALISWSVSLFFTIFNWFMIRMVMIWLRRKFPAFKDTVKRIMIFMSALILSVFLVDFVGSLILKNIIGINFNNASHSEIILPIILMSTMTMAIYEAIYFYIRLKKSVREEEQAKQLVVQAQLDALRNQAQPHFFFNSMNALRDIIDQNTKEQAKEFVDNISEVYRFLLESQNANLVTLSKELKFAKAYIHVQSERFGDNLKVNWNIDNAQMDKQVIPMSLQLLLENAIKHNVVSRSKPLRVDVNVSEDSINVQNNFQPKSTQVASTGIGLQNIKDRYQLMTDESIKIHQDDKIFKVTLPLLNQMDHNLVNENFNH